MRMTNHDPGYQPWVISANKPTWRAIYDKLCEYEDAEEQGRLVILPCKAGNTVHFIFRDKVYSGLILHVNLYKGFETQSITMDVKYSVRGHVLICAEEIGKTVFFTYAEAEAALKGESEKETPTIIPAIEESVKTEEDSEPWLCLSCRNYPPSSTDGKPCSQCNPSEVWHSCYDPAEEGE